MAGNKLHAKNKTKDDRNRVNKSTSHSTPLRGRERDDNQTPDLSLLRKPIETSITGFAHARRIYDTGTEELKGLLSAECDLIYECRVCRNLFRSLVNFISHKRVYCKQKFSKALHAHFINNNNTSDETLKIIQIEQEYQEFLKNKDKQEVIASDDEKIPFTKDLTTIIESLNRNNEITAVVNGPIRQTMNYQNIPTTNVAVFQNVVMSDVPKDTMRDEVIELDEMMSNDNAVLKDGKFVQPNELVAVKKAKTPEKGTDCPIIQISDDDEEVQNLPVCKICNLQFSTQKTLKFHMKYKHVENRLVFPCPDCTDIFSTSWSVYRHLFKVHRKTAAQIRRLRESIQSKAFKMDNPPAHFERRKNNTKPVIPQKITEEERMDQENQAWMDNMEMDGELPRCGGCGRRFERRAALAAHTHTCQPRRAAHTRIHANTHRRTTNPPCKLLNEKTEKKIEIQIRKDYNKGGPSLATDLAGVNGQTPDELAVKGGDDATERSDSRAAPLEETGTELEKAGVESFQGEGPTTDEQDDNFREDDDLLLIDKKYRLNVSEMVEKENLEALKLKVGPHVDLIKLFCKKCKRKYSTLEHLNRHMGHHFNWKRYACKLCDFRSYDKEKCTMHIRTAHRMKGDEEFYASTVRALGAEEAGADARPHASSPAEIRSDPESRRPSKSSSDSSPFSDESNGSKTDNSHTSVTKRARLQNKRMRKRRREDILPSPESDSTSKDVDEKKSTQPIPLHTVMQVIFGDREEVKCSEPDSASPHVPLAEATVLEEVEVRDTQPYGEPEPERESLAACQATVARRPIRKRYKTKHDDFEYDLSNLLKLEAEAYKESHSAGNFPQKIQLKRKPLLQSETESTESTSERFRGALQSLSTKAVLQARAHLMEAHAVQAAPTPSRLLPSLKTPSVKSSSAESSCSPPAIILNRGRPVPASQARARKDAPALAQSTPTAVSPRKFEETKTDTPTKVQQTYQGKKAVPKDGPMTLELSDMKVPDSTRIISGSLETILSKNVEPAVGQQKSVTDRLSPSITPICNNIDLLKNPAITRKITDLSKSGLKTKILVIKGPLNRNNEIGKGDQSGFKIQTIKLSNDNKIPVMVSENTHNLPLYSARQVTVSDGFKKFDHTEKKIVPNNGDSNNLSTSNSLSQIAKPVADLLNKSSEPEYVVEKLLSDED